MYPEFVCGECFGDRGMKDFCHAYADNNTCDFCGAKSVEVIAAPLDDVIEHIKSCVHQHYDDPGNAGLFYETAEGGYQGATYDTAEIFEELGLELPRDRDGRLFDAISKGMHNDVWCEAEPYRLSPAQRLQFSWEAFCRIIKHERRFFFLHSKRASPYDDEDISSPAETLRNLFAYAQSAGAFIKMPKGRTLFRARYQPKGKKFCSAAQLGPPPLDHALQTNRMSPPGIAMTYAAEDKETALAETADSAGTFAVGEFVNDRELLILDLTNLPEAPGVFAELPDTLEFDPRPRLNFLHSISREISKPIARDDRVHVEYVPTQVVTEYVRTVVEIDGMKVDGIRYNSSRRHAATALVLFADQDDLVLDALERPTFYQASKRWVRRVASAPVKVSAKDIKRWSDRPKRFPWDPA